MSDADLERVRAALAEAERVSRQKDEFIDALSHELRTPITAILMWADVLRKQFGGAELARGLAAIERNARAQARMIDDLLDISRIVGGRLRLETCETTFAPAIEAALERARPLADARGVALRASLAPGLPPLVGDPARLQQIAGHLLANAVKFTPKGGEVLVELTADGATQELRVVDTGIGIAPERLPRLFERFRGDVVGPSRDRGGLGVGLAIVHHLVALHGGEVRADSQGPQRGATFVVRLPGVAAVDPPAAARPRELAGRRVLLVEADPDVRELLRLLLADRGAEVHGVATPDEALAQLAADPPDALVGDPAAPLRSGAALLPALRRLPVDRGGHTPLLTPAGFAPAEGREPDVTAGLAAPGDPAALVAALARLPGRTSA